MAGTVEMTDAELEQLEQDHIRDLAAQEWEKKYREDLESDPFGFSEEALMTLNFRRAGQEGEFR